MTDIRLVTNSVSPNQVRETDDAWIIEDVPIHKPLEGLDGGYTPRANVEQTAAGWNGVPATLFHVRNNQGKPIPAHRDPSKHIGEVRDPKWDGGQIRVGQIELRKDDLERSGTFGEKIREALENGEPIEVSSQYASTDLPPGEYDGEFRSNAAAIVRPDSVAILPHGTGRCSVEDGCGINPQMAANADLTVPMTDDPVSPESGPGEGGGSRSDSTEDMDTDAGPFERLGRTVANALGLDTESIGDEPAESGADETNQMADKTTELVDDYGFDADNLPSEDTECFGRIYDAVTADEAEESGETETETETEQTDDDTGGGAVVEMTEDELMQRVDARAEERAEQIAANREAEREKTEIATTIVANSAEYDDTESVLEDYPTVAALKNKRESVTDRGGVPGSGMSANFDANGDDDDLLEDVGAGVF